MRRVALTALTFHTREMAIRFHVAGVVSGTFAPTGGAVYDAVSMSPDAAMDIPVIDATDATVAIDAVIGAAMAPAVESPVVTDTPPATSKTSKRSKRA